MAAATRPFVDLGRTEAQVQNGANYTWRQVSLNDTRIEETNNLIGGLIYSDPVTQTLVASVTENDISTSGDGAVLYGDNLTSETTSEFNTIVGKDATVTNSDQCIVLTTNDAVTSSIVLNSDQCVLIGTDTEATQSDQCINIGGVSDVDQSDRSISLGIQNNFQSAQDSISIGYNNNTEFSFGDITIGRDITVNPNSDNCISIQANALGLTSAVTTSNFSINIGCDGDIDNSDNSIQIGCNSDLINANGTIQIGGSSDVSGDNNIILGNDNDQTGARTIQIGHLLNTAGAGTDYMCVSQNPFANLTPQNPAPGSVILGAGEDVSALPKLQFLASGMEGLKNDVAPAAPYTPYDGLTAVAVPANGGFLRCKIGTHNVKILVFPDSDTANAP